MFFVDYAMKQKVKMCFYRLCLGGRFCYRWALVSHPAILQHVGLIGQWMPELLLHFFYNNVRCWPCIALICHSAQAKAWSNFTAVHFDSKKNNQTQLNILLYLGKGSWYSFIFNWKMPIPWFVRTILIF